MQVQYRHLPPVIPDNEAAYFSLLEGVVGGVDPEGEMMVTRGSSGYHFRIAPSTSLHIDSLVAELTTLHNLLHIQLELSKSMKASSTISFQIPL